MIINENCSICESTEWENLDRLRNQEQWYDRNFRLEDEPVGFKICKECGYLTYDYIDEERLSQSYQRERQVMTGNVHLTLNRKRCYHRAFLDSSREFIDKLVKTEENIICADIGAAQGYFLKFLNDDYDVPKENLHGSEYNKSFADYGKYEWGLNINRELPDIKYDFISCYHVLEHIQYPEKALSNMRDMLSDDGLLYLSIPYWLDYLQQFDGNIANDFEYLYHLNHVNVFTKTSFKNLLKKIGFKIIQEDSELYGYTVMCVKTDPVDDIEKEEYKAHIKRLEEEIKAIDHIKKQEYKQAISVIPKYPDAYLMMSLSQPILKDLQAQREVLEKGIKECPYDARLLSQLAKVYFQWDDSGNDKGVYYSNNIMKAEELFHKVIEMKPGIEDTYYFLAQIEGKYKKNYDKAVEYLRKNVEINPTKYVEAENIVGYFRREQGIGK